MRKRSGLILHVWWAVVSHRATARSPPQQYVFFSFANPPRYISIQISPHGFRATVLPGRSNAILSHLRMMCM
ncbi:hypothetical protein GGR54DRAFT_619048 [Hypoxylon sp. NC1633]|nr:hypothetical protein GGR54DRAFT_619048 [Hypoxylon sp. NC1633]